MLNKPIFENAVIFHCSEDSCGFEHVFVGETKNGQEIMGLHNWVQFYLQEKHNHVDYKGYKARDNKDSVRKYCVTVCIMKILNTLVLCKNSQLLMLLLNRKNICEFPNEPFFIVVL